MITVGIGANLYSRNAGEPLNTCKAALEALGKMQVKVVRRSRWYWSVPVPVSDQPNFVNAVVEVETEYNPQELLLILHKVEANFGRIRESANAARVLDLDLLTYNDEVRGPGSDVRLPHPRMHERAFVLKPFIELASHWKHPIMKSSALELLAQIPSGQVAELFELKNSHGAKM